MTDPRRARLCRDLLEAIAAETRGNPSMVLLDGRSYKPIPTELADRIEAALLREPPEPASFPTSLPLASKVWPADVAAKFHEVYERLAPSFGYQTRPETRKDWVDLPEGNKQLMMAVAKEVLLYIAELSEEARAAAPAEKADA